MRSAFKPRLIPGLAMVSALLQRRSLSSSSLALHQQSRSGVPSDKQSSPDRALPALNPLQSLDAFFRANKAAVQLHRELLITIAEGNADEASEIARVLASKVRRHMEDAKQETSVPSSEKASEPSLGILSNRPELLQEAMEKAEEVTHADSGNSPAEERFWKSSESLTMTILETAFEMDSNENPEDVGDLPLETAAASLEHEQALKLLDEYLTQQAEPWKVQKHLVAKLVLDAAKNVGLTPMSIHYQDEDAAASRSLNVLKHCNIVIRGEVPELMLSNVNAVGESSLSSLRRECTEELLKLEAQMMKRTSRPMTESERHVALMELMMSRTHVRYSVGLLKSLSSVMDEQNTHGGSDAKSVQFQSEIVRLLNPRHDGVNPTAADQEMERVLTTPIIPYTFMLKLCLWYHHPSTVEKSSETR